MADDEAMLTIASRLDAADVYSATMVTVGADDGGANPFDTIGAGVGLDNDGSFFVFAYHADAGSAEQAVLTIEEILDGESIRTSEPWSEFFDSSQVAADGDVVVAVLRLAADRRPSGRFSRPSLRRQERRSARLCRTCTRGA